MSPAYRKAVHLCRVVHLYLSLFGLAAMGFFAVTGLMLNHESWFNTDHPSIERTIELPTALLTEPDKLAIVELLRAEHGAVGALQSFDVREDELKVLFTRPGRKFDATIKRDTGETVLTIEHAGFSGIVGDLHKGKYSGPVWSVLLDATCVLIIAVSMTGLVLWSALRSRGRLGAVALAVGTVVTAAVYWLGVP